MIADSGALKSLVPLSFDKYVVLYLKQAVSFRLASDVAPLSVRGVKTFHLPFVDEWGGVRIVSEEGCSHELIGCPLFACGRRKLSLPGEESSSEPGWVWLKDVHGERFRSPVDQMGNVPILRLVKVEEAVVTANLCPSVSPCPLRQSALSGQAEISPENRSHLLFVLHSRLGHATGQCLEATLKEKGMGMQFSAKECKESDGALFLGQIVREGEKQVRSIIAARLKQRDNGSFFPAELETVKQKDIVERFKLPADGQLLPAVLNRLAEQAPPVSDPVPPIPSDEVPVDVDVVADQAAKEANTAEFLRWSEMSKSQRRN
uniref:Uncharacterized protein n=1 Tax=Chromera velia CCMP2878 TaxID=1169474 RepID=A0A0G4HZ15_9ALVE|eukprot:Cvel_1556.t1-p1 / transcript=Cvel_1556.t1 / gene=Cvel_1556 / organism=Chromera_velia_CCMP2878 / gene_product=hypothetical protein / transcript_product=hypothetical protein / location=Cvel_scaffold55:65208-67758(-) / protein_length=317 / sequence_SO=supercontig / SO=protein_coding / is_pseudo=false